MSTYVFKWICILYEIKVKYRCKIISNTPTSSLLFTSIHLDYAFSFSYILNFSFAHNCNKIMSYIPTYKALILTSCFYLPLQVMVIFKCNVIHKYWMMMIMAWLKMWPFSKVCPTLEFVRMKLTWKFISMFNDVIVSFW